MSVDRENTPHQTNVVPHALVPSGLTPRGGLITDIRGNREDRQKCLERVPHHDHA